VRFKDQILVRSLITRGRTGKCNLRMAAFATGGASVQVNWQ
jgi:hypothetical protein